jgi:hypothetical protein
MTRKIPLTIALAALVGFAAPAFAAETTHAAKHDPQAATSTVKPSKHASTKSSSVQGRKAKATKKAAAKKSTAATPATTPAPAK